MSTHIIPDLVDNSDVSGRRLADVLSDALQMADAPALWVATAYFNLDGFETLGAALEKVEELRLLLGTEQEQSSF